MLKKTCLWDVWEHTAKMYVNIIPKSGQISDNHFFNEETNNLKLFAFGRHPTELRTENNKVCFYNLKVPSLTNVEQSGLNIFKITLHSVLSAFKDQYHSFWEAKED